MVRKTTETQTSTTHTRQSSTEVSRPRIIFLHPHLLRVIIMEPPSTRTANRTHASRTPFSRETFGSMAELPSPLVRHQHCRGDRLFASQDACVPNGRSAINTDMLASANLPRTPHPHVHCPHGSVPVSGPCASRVIPLGRGTFSTAVTRTSCPAPLSHGRKLVTRARASSAAPPTHGKGSCASRAAPPGTHQQSTTTSAQT